MPLGLFLQAAPPRDVIARMLRNLKEIHRAPGDWRRLLAVAERLVVLLPEAWEERRDRGLAYADSASRRRRARPGRLPRHARDATDREQIARGCAGLRPWRGSPRLH